MSKKAKTKVYALINWRRRQLFSVEERASGDLVLSPHPDFKSVHASRNKGDVKHEHWSIHTSNDGRDTTITHKIFYDHSSSELATFVPNTNDRLLMPLFCRLEAPVAAKDDTKIRAKDTNVCIAEFFSVTTSMIYSVYVTNVLGELNIEAELFNFYDLVFQRYRLMVFVSYVHVPTIYGMQHAFSGSRYYSPGEDFPDDREPIKSMIGHPIWELHFNSATEFANAQIFEAGTSEKWAPVLDMAVQWFGRRKIQKGSNVSFNREPFK